MRLLCVTLATAAAVTASAMLATAAALPLVAADTSRPSAIEISGGTTYVVDLRDERQSSVNPLEDRQSVACIVFTNHGSRTATKVGLSLAMMDATGTVIAVDVIHPVGKFFVNARSAFSGGNVSAEVPNGNCHGISAESSALRSTFAYRLRRASSAIEVAAILVSAREIVYDDGTAWRSDQVPQSGDHLALPTAAPFVAAVADGPPVVTPGTVTGSPIEITDAFEHEFVRRSGGDPAGPGLLQLFAAIPTTTRARFICMSFANRDPRVITKVRVNLAVVDRAGIVGGIDTLDSKGPFGTPKPSTDSGGNCESIRGWWDADTFVYEPRDGTPFAVGRVVITPAVVDFADGTSWSAPAPPTIGVPLAR